MTSKTKEKPAKVLQHPAGSEYGEAPSSGIDNSCGRLSDPNSTVVTDSLGNDSAGTTKSDRAAKRVLKYLTWRLDNGAAYDFAESIAVAQARAGQRVSGNYLISRIRKAGDDLSDRHGRPCRPNNDYAPLLLREIALRNPAVAGHMEVRTHVYDGLLTKATLAGLNG